MTEYLEAIILIGVWLNAVLNFLILRKGKKANSS